MYQGSFIIEIFAKRKNYYRLRFDDVSEGQRFLKKLRTVMKRTQKDKFVTYSDETTEDSLNGRGTSSSVSYVSGPGGSLGSYGTNSESFTPSYDGSGSYTDSGSYSSGSYTDSGSSQSGETQSGVSTSDPESVTESDYTTSDSVTESDYS
eukprot:TRINITY_DN504_c0_g1_i1.p1 TRINITY_DN504_c0_g1~~TRINITY_DN504_c0_g1_i1.p1  ORF type:complete len:150 (-),score=39.94 TRINITY_DN504_c0_g1_i1:323-772(-)